jgi:hypothetical protein
VDLGVEFHQDCGGFCFEPGLGAPEGFREELGDLLDRDAAGKLASGSPSYTVGNCEYALVRIERSFSDFSEEIRLLRVEAQSEKGVLIQGADLAFVAESGPFKGFHARGWAEVAWGRGKAGQDGCELKVDQTKAAVGLPVGDVSREGIIVADTVLLEF